MLTTIVVLLVVGLIVGALARAVLPGRQGLPLWLTAVIGAGSLLLAGLVIPGRHLLVEAIVGIVIAAAIIALSQGGVRSRSHSRI
ncbi:MAG: GlsB/YeaQ/YmgE family stress response membrane protein [Actinobacteria bacterium]|nr:GlsB/YeaQ/YmgE family stress response membrane protein [Actinomycetota bacterium]